MRPGWKAQQSSCCFYKQLTRKKECLWGKVCQIEVTEGGQEGDAHQLITTASS